MSTYEYRRNGIKYDIGTEGWQFNDNNRPNNILDYARDYTLAYMRVFAPVKGVIATMLAGVLAGAWHGITGLPGRAG